MAFIYGYTRCLYVCKYSIDTFYLLVLHHIIEKAEKNEEQVQQKRKK